MSITIDGVYVGGVVRIEHPLALTEGTPVRIVVTPLQEMADDPLAAFIGTCPSKYPVSLAQRHDELLYGSTSDRTL